MQNKIISYHYTEQYLLTPNHPITVKVIGCGGSGSQMLGQLARINASLRLLGHPGLEVQAWDPDVVTEANMARQLFSQVDLGQYKAQVLIQRLNRFYGTAWLAHPLKYTAQQVKEKNLANIIITCVDNVDARIIVGECISFGDKRAWSSSSEFVRPYYWLDLGNTKTSGQVVLGTFRNIKQPSRTRHTVPSLPSIIQLVPDLKKYEDKDTTPSCSLAEALNKQDLFINSILAQYGANLIWKLFRELRIQHHGVYVNLETLQTNPITIRPK